MAGIDTDSIVEVASQFLVSYGADDWSDAYHYDYQYELSKIVEGLSKELKSKFSEWINQICLPTRTEIGELFLNIPNTAKYLTFNYTPLLTNVYQIPKSNILYIHGEAGEDKDLVIGHAWNPSEIPSPNNIPNPESLDIRIMEGNEIIYNYFVTTFKNTKRIIEANKFYFSDLKNITAIFILGHSLSNVDLHYFKEVINNIHLEKVTWVITYYGDDELESHRKTMHQLGVDNRLISFCALEELLEFNK